MALSNDIISQFAKLVNIDSNNKETFVYGTVSKNDGKNYVRLDGSNINTPMLSTSACSNGDRVTVLIKNHEAVAIGNISSPSASKAKSLTAESIDGKFANIDFSNVDDVTIGNFYSRSGLIKNATVKNATITGELSGVAIKGSLIESGTVTADKLILKGDNGLYYKLNVDGIKTESEQTERNSLNGDIFMAKSINTSKINVSDLVDFGATIGGFSISSNSIYSGIKQTVDNTTRGIYLGNDGQVAFGDSSSYIKLYIDADNTYKLDISANKYSFHDSPSFVRGRSADGGFDFYFKETGMRIVFDGTNGKIWRVDTSGIWTALAG